MRLTRHARRAVTVAATATFLLGASASLAYADTTTAPGQSVVNHGQCVSNPDLFPGAKDTGPLTINKNNFNIPQDNQQGHPNGYEGCNAK